MYENFNFSFDQIDEIFVSEIWDAVYNNAVMSGCFRINRVDVKFWRDISPYRTAVVQRFYSKNLN